MLKNVQNQFASKIRVQYIGNVESFASGIHILDDQFEKIKGAPNYRHLRGFPIFGTGQPTEDAMIGILNKAKEGIGKENSKIFWFTMRQEPIVYVNGCPYAPRDPDNR